MNAPESITMNVYQRLNAARKEFHTLKLKKTGQNTFAKYSYFELGDFLIPALEVFERHGLTAVVRFEKELAAMEIFNAANPVDRILITSPMGSAALKGCHEVQNIGAVETYQRRYLWVAALEIVEHDALDATTGKDTPAKQSAKSVAAATRDNLSDEEQQFLKDLAMEVIGNLPDEIAMFHAYEAAKKSLDADEQVAFWAFFDSKSRAALKRAKDAELANTP